jgi:hypothetical protein
MGRYAGKEYTIATKDPTGSCWSLKLYGSTIRLMSLEEAVAEMEHLLPAHGFVNLRLLKMVDFTFTAEVKIHLEGDLVR